MNAQNLKRFMTEQSPDWVVSELSDGQRIFCNGHIVAPTLEPVSGQDTHPRMARGCVKLWQEIPAEKFCAAKRGGLYGTQIALISREFILEPKRVHFRERYVRVWNPDAEFRISSTRDYAAVYEHGSLMGIVMPVMFREREPQPWGRTVPDEIIYHECPATESPGGC